MKNDVLQGLILNPGNYAALYQNEKNLLDNYQVFLRHLEDDKETYKSVIFTSKSAFLNYCSGIGKPLPFFESGLNDSVRFYLKHYIQSGAFGFVHRYSMSGFNLPARYLWYDFDINFNEHDTALNGLKSDYTGDHDKLINDVSNGKFLCGVTYENRLNIIGIPGIKNKIQILYNSPDIPYNSYLYKRNLDSNLKVLVKNAILKLNTDNGKKAAEVRKNSMRITGWVSSSEDEYVRMLDSCFNVLNTKLPKPRLVLDNQSSENSHKDRLNDILIVVTNKLKKINAWDIESPSPSVKKIKSIIINLKSYAEVYIDKEIVISLNAEINENVLEPLKIQVAEFKGDNNKITKSVMVHILELIELKTTIKYDFQGLFINLGREDGLTNCKLILPGGEIISPELYSIEKHKTIFKNSDKQSIDKFRNKQVTIKYDLDEVLKL